MQLMRQQDIPAYARATILAEFIVKSQFLPQCKRANRRDALPITVSLHAAVAANSIAGRTKAMEYLGHAKPRERVMFAKPSQWKSVAGAMLIASGVSVAGPAMAASRVTIAVTETIASTNPLADSVNLMY